ncbi:DUF1540 domain-containing protein [Georgenia daeguensis]|uniref:DUF1540 domain-containing protein n=1 Tax=Georgenia daeguensis TaxID=908355 RepID=A0ABP8EWK6_9MICO
MSTVMDLPPVTTCSVAGCSYNDEHEHCHAAAITISGAGSDAQCATFIPLSHHGGLEKVVAHVGACSREDCVHNQSLECSAPAVRVGPGRDSADCLTYSPR